MRWLRAGLCLVAIGGGVLVACSSEPGSTTSEPSAGLASTIDVGEPQMAMTTTIEDLLADETISEVTRSLLDLATEWVLDRGETEPGSFEPLVSVEPSTEPALPGTSLFPADAGRAQGSVIVANPSLRAVRASVLCLRQFRAVGCTEETAFYGVDLAFGEASQLGYSFPATDGDEITFVVLVHDDRNDPLPASITATIVVGHRWDSWRDRSPLVRPGPAPVVDRSLPCTGYPRIYGGHDGRQLISRDAAVVAQHRPCEDASAAVLVFANRRYQLEPEWPLFVHMDADTTLEWAIPRELIAEDEIESLQMIIITRVDAGADKIEFSYSAAEEAEFEIR